MSTLLSEFPEAVTPTPDDTQLAQESSAVPLFPWHGRQVFIAGIRTSSVLVLARA